MFDFKQTKNQPFVVVARTIKASCGGDKEEEEGTILLGTLKYKKEESQSDQVITNTISKSTTAVASVWQLN